MPPMARRDPNKLVYMVIFEWEPDKTKEVIDRLRNKRNPQDGWDVEYDYCATGGGKLFRLITVERDKIVNFHPLQPETGAFAWNDLGKVTVIPVLWTEDLVAVYDSPLPPEKQQQAKT